MEQKKQFVEEIKGKIDKSIHIARVPKHTKTWFIDYANDYFEGDYGHCLKHVTDTFRGMTPIGYEELQVQVDELRNELELVKGLLNKKETKEDVKIMANGKEKRRS